MSSGRGGTKKNEYSKTKQQNDETEEDQVDKLLRATQDDILLKLSVDSHMSRASSSHAAIHPDLDRRFQALRSSSSSFNSKPPSLTVTAKASSVVVDDDGDLFARFAALKSTIPSYSKKNQVVEVNDHGGGDEVDEVIRWAIDAAALDPSPPSDDDDVSDDSSDHLTDDDDDEDDEDDDPKHKNKNKNKKKTNGKQK